MRDRGVAVTDAATVANDETDRTGTEDSDGGRVVVFALTERRIALIADATEANEACRRDGEDGMSSARSLGLSVEPGGGVRVCADRARRSTFAALTADAIVGDLRGDSDTAWSERVEDASDPKLPCRAVFWSVFSSLLALALFAALTGCDGRAASGCAIAGAADRCCRPEWEEPPWRERRTGAGGDGTRRCGIVAGEATEDVEGRRVGDAGDVVEVEERRRERGGL